MSSVDLEKLFIVILRIFQREKVLKGVRMFVEHPENRIIIEPYVDPSRNEAFDSPPALDDAAGDVGSECGEDIFVGDEADDLVHGLTDEPYHHPSGSDDDDGASPAVTPRTKSPLSKREKPRKMGRPRKKNSKMKDPYELKEVDEGFGGKIEKDDESGRRSNRRRSQVGSYFEPEEDDTGLRFVLTNRDVTDESFAPFSRRKKDDDENDNDDNDGYDGGGGEDSDDDFDVDYRGLPVKSPRVKPAITEGGVKRPRGRPPKTPPVAIKSEPVWDIDEQSAEYKEQRRRALTDKTPPNLEDVIVVETEEPDPRPHKCEHCDFAAEKKSGLNEHMTVHSKVRPYKCKHCDLRFKSRNGAALHILRVHCEPTKCQICSSVVKHIKEHVRLVHKKVFCGICKQIFSKRGILEHRAAQKNGGQKCGEKTSRIGQIEKVPSEETYS